MSAPQIAAVVLAAGKGTRMKSDLPKVLHPVAGRPMINAVLASVAEAGCARAVLVLAPGMDEVARAAGVDTAVQHVALGTAHAVLAARDNLAGFDGPVLILFGDTPLMRPETLTRMAAALDATAAVAVLGMRPADPGQYGRLICGADGALEAIVEYNDASEAQRAIGLCNSGVMAVSGRHLFELLDAVGNDNAKQEYYLTDIVALAHARGLGCVAVEGDADEVLGVNSRVDLAQAEAIAQGRLRRAAMEAGATMADPASVYLNHDTLIGRDVTIGPNVVFGGGVTIGDGVDILGFCHIDGASVGDGAKIGPFARLRPGAEIGPGAHIGNFVEIKKARIEAGAKVNHLSYIGDARVGAGANVGAGTITCNYDGFTKAHTDIGDGAFIGSNTALVAPVSVGGGAIVGAGSVVTEDVPDDALAVARGVQMNIPGWATNFRARKGGAKAAAGKKAGKAGS